MKTQALGIQMFPVTGSLLYIFRFSDLTFGSKSLLKFAVCSIKDSIMMNGHKSSDSRFGSSSGLLSGKTPKSPPVASLCNLGNTCFLNSVLYTLRFTPGFLHSLHHMVHDLGLTGNGGSKTGSSSKRNNGLTLQQSQTNGSTNSISDAETELVHDVIDQVTISVSCYNLCRDLGWYAEVLLEISH